MRVSLVFVCEDIDSISLTESRSSRADRDLSVTIDQLVYGVALLSSLKTNRAPFL